MRTIRVSLAHAEDAQVVFTLTRAAFAEFEGRLDPPSSLFRESLADTERAIAAGQVAVAWEGEDPVGAVRLTPEPGCLYVGRLAVLPSHRRAGIGTALMRFAETHAAALGLPHVKVEVREALPRNVAFFTALGYRIVRRAPHPRNPTAYTLTMTKPVEPARTTKSAPNAAITRTGQAPSR